MFGSSRRAWEFALLSAEVTATAAWSRHASGGIRLLARLFGIGSLGFRAVAVYDAGGQMIANTSLVGSF